MEARDLSKEEVERLCALYSLDLLDSGANAQFDRITRLACRLLDMPTALVSLVDADRQWFGSRVGLGATETPRDQAFCAHAIRDRQVMVVPDAQLDPRFEDNPLVTDEPFIRFYAGAPIASPGGYRIGTLCIIDYVPRTFSAEDEMALRDLADLIERELLTVEFALTDQLTGLANRRAFVTAGERLLAVSRTNGQPMSVLFADLNGLKATNDRLGHAAGDELLRRSADLIRKTVRGSDVVARLGGDELGVLLLDSDRDQASVICEQLQRAIDDVNQANPDALPLSISIGSARADQAESFDDLLARADAQMYERKRQANSRASVA